MGQVSSLSPRNITSNITSNIQNLGNISPRKYNQVSGDTFWTSTKVKDVASKDIITVSVNDTIETSLKKLHDNMILSAPLVGSDGKCIGFWGMDNLLIALVKNTCSPLTLKDRPRSKHIKTDTNHELQHRHKAFHSKTVGSCHFEDNFHGIPGNATLYDVMVAFSAGVQRIAVFDNHQTSGHVKKIISQSSILSYIAEDTSRLGSLEDVPAEKLGIPWNRVIKATSNMITIDVLNLMHAQGLWGIPIVDPDTERVVSHLSLTDFKTIHEEDDFQILLAPVIDYVAKVREAQGKPLGTIIHARTDTLMKDIVKILVTEHVHQMYLFDEEDQPTALVSLTSICYKVFHSEIKNSVS